MLFENHYFECACYSNEHLLKFIYDREELELWAGIFMRDRRWCSRIWLAIKYIVRYKSRYGQWGNWILMEDDVDRFITMLTVFKADLEKSKEAQSG